MNKRYREKIPQLPKKHFLITFHETYKIYVPIWNVIITFNFFVYRLTIMFNRNTIWPKTRFQRDTLLWRVNRNVIPKVSCSNWKRLRQISFVRWMGIEGRRGRGHALEVKCANSNRTFGKYNHRSNCRRKFYKIKFSSSSK